MKCFLALHEISSNETRLTIGREVTLLLPTFGIIHRHSGDPNSGMPTGTSENRKEGAPLAAGAE